MRPGRNEWRHAPEAWAEDFGDLIKSRELSSCLQTRESRFRRICALRAPHVGWVESWRCKSSQHRKIVSLSPHVEKPCNSKVIKSFVPEPISWMSCISDSLCLSPTSVYLAMYQYKWYLVYVCVKIHTQLNKLEVVFRIGERRSVANFAYRTAEKRNSLFVSLCTCMHICGGDFK